MRAAATVEPNKIALTGITEWFMAGDIPEQIICGTCGLNRPGMLNRPDMKKIAMAIKTQSMAIDMSPELAGYTGGQACLPPPGMLASKIHQMTFLILVLCSAVMPA